MQEEFSPGMLVRNPDQPDWGLGQVQSGVGNKVTANFEHAGKLTLNIAVVRLTAVDNHSEPSK
jgi:hypothetical protein